MSDEPSSAIALRLASIEAALRRIETAHIGLLTRKLSRSEQAKRAKCSVKTLRNRERKLELKRLANGT